MRISAISAKFQGEHSTDDCLLAGWLGVCARDAPILATIHGAAAHVQGLVAQITRRRGAAHIFPCLSYVRLKLMTKVAAHVPQFYRWKFKAMSGEISGHDRSRSKSNRLHVRPSFGFPFTNVPWIPLKGVIFPKSWRTSTGYISNSLGSSITRGWFSTFIGSRLCF